MNKKNNRNKRGQNDKRRNELGRNESGRNDSEENNYTQDRLEKAEFYILNQKYSEALKILKEVVDSDEANPRAHYIYGLALEGSNQQEEAKKQFRRVLELEPDHVEAQEHLDRLIGE